MYLGDWEKFLAGCPNPYHLPARRHVTPFPQARSIQTIHITLHNLSLTHAGGTPYLYLRTFVQAFGIKVVADQMIDPQYHSAGVCWHRAAVSILYNFSNSTAAFVYLASGLATRYACCAVC